MIFQNSTKLKGLLKFVMLFLENFDQFVDN